MSCLPSVIQWKKTAWRLEKKALRLAETSGDIHRKTQRHISQDVSVKQHLCENIETVIQNFSRNKLRDLLGVPGDMKVGLQE
jgi:hypothetical protein